MEYIHPYNASEVEKKAQSRDSTSFFVSLTQTICSFSHQGLSLCTVCFLHVFLLCDRKQIFCNNLVVWSRHHRFLSQEESKSLQPRSTELVNACASA